MADAAVLGDSLYRKRLWRELERGYLFMLTLERVVVANDAAGFGPVLVSCGHTVSQVAQRRKGLLHVQDVAVDVHALQKYQQNRGLSTQDKP